MAFDPYHKWLGIAPKDQPPHHYRLLGIDAFEGDRDVIDAAANRVMSYLKDIATGDEAAHSQRLLNEVAQARLCLLNRDKKAAYDKELKTKLPASKPAKRRKPAAKPATANPSPAPLPMSKPDTPAVVQPVPVGISVESKPISVRAEKTRSGGKGRGKSPWLFPAIGVCLLVLSIAALLAVMMVLNGDDPTPTDPKPDPTIAATGDDRLVRDGDVDRATDTPGDTATDTTAATDTATPADTATDSVSSSAEPIDVLPTLPDVKVPQITEKPTTSGPVPEFRPVEPTPAKSTSAPNVERPSPPAPGMEKLPVPPDAALERPLALVKEVYGEEHSNAKTDEELQVLAKKLFSDASETDKPIERYALLRVARDIAAQGCDGLTAFQIIDAMDREFQVDIVTMKASVLYSLTEKARLPADRKSIAQQALSLVDLAVARDDFELSGKLAAMALSEARKLRDAKYVKSVTARSKEIEELGKAYATVKPTAERLKEDPTDAEANSVVGRYRCLLKGDWENGLPMLALGSDADLKALAVKELEEPADQNVQLQLGDAWWEFADPEEGRTQANILARAAYWYARAEPNLSGVEKAKCLKRIEEVRQRSGGQYTWGLQFAGAEWVQTDLRYTGKTPLTIEVWASAAVHELQPVIANYHGRGLGLQVVDTGHWSFSVRDQRDYRIASSDDKAVIGRRTHVAGVFDGKNVRLYVNGRLQKTYATLTSTHKASSHPIMIGADPDDNSRPQRYFRGIIDSVHVAQTALYRNDFTPKDPPEGTRWTALLLRLDEGKGDVASDTSGYQNHTTIHGAQWVKVPVGLIPPTLLDP